MTTKPDYFIDKLDPASDEGCTGYGLFDQTGYCYFIADTEEELLRECEVREIVIDY